MRTLSRVLQVLLVILGMAQVSTAQAACGGRGERLCDLFGDGSIGCSAGLVDVLGKCQVPRECGGEGERLCFVFIDGRGGCNPELVDIGGACRRPDCGGQGQRACALFGRDSCDAGLVEVNNTCFMRGDCGGAGRRACLLGERAGNSCDPNLVERNGMCIATNCGALGQRACAIVGRDSCDVGLVEVNNACLTRGDCGAADRRACLIGERVGNSCDANLVERGGMCIATDCGAFGQRACAIFGRNSCDDGLVEVNDACFTRTECGDSNQRACLVGERRGNSCDPNHVEVSGVCYPCGALGQRACAIVGRLSCDGGLVEANGMCFTRRNCGAASQRPCLIGERRGNACNSGLVENHGLCEPVSGSLPPASPAVFVFVRTDPPAPVLRPKEPVSILAAVHDGASKKQVVARRIDIFQAVYSGPGSPAPRLLHTCRDVQTCRVQLGTRKPPNTISYMARATTDAGVFETPIRLTDIKFAGAPVRMSVAAESTPPRGIAELSHKRTIDMVFYAGGYDLTAAAGAEMFSDRLKDEMETMMGISPSLTQPSSLADNFGAVNFHVSQARATVTFGGIENMCEHSTAGPVAFGDAMGILHPNFICRDWSAPGPYFSAKAPLVTWHEIHHAAFGLSDEYCVGTVHSQHAVTPNAYVDKAECVRLSSNAATCKRIAEPVDCVGAACTCITDFWRSDSGTGDVMNIGRTLEQADDLRSANRKFALCRAGLC